MEQVQQEKTGKREPQRRPAADPRPVFRAAPPPQERIQANSLIVTSPRHPSELEAEDTAKQVMRMPASDPIPVASRETPPSLSRFADAVRLMRARSASDKDAAVARFGADKVVARKADDKDKVVARVASDKDKVVARVASDKDKVVARKGDGEGAVAPGVAAEIANAKPAGAPLPHAVRSFMEPRFGADFGKVRLHTGDHAAKLSRKVNAQAFTHGAHIFFGKDRFQPDTHQGKELIAHELTHTIQQGEAVQRSPDVTVRERAGGAQLQRLGMSDVLDFFADKANLIPGFRMFTIVLGVNPINMSAVDRSAANILRAIVEFIPGGGLITKALDAYGVFDKVGAWIEGQLSSLGLSGATIKAAITEFIKSLGVSDLFDLGGVWTKAKAIFSDPIDRIISFVKSLASQVLQFIKDAILKPLAALAQQTPGWDLLCAVLGSNPITGQAVPRTAETLIGGFMKLIGQEEIWQNIQKANAIARCMAWFQNALAGLMGFVRAIPGLFLAAVKALTIEDIVLLPQAFIKVGKAFGDFLGKFMSWAGSTIWDLLEIVFSVVAPSVIVYIKRAAAAFKTILKNPMGFVKNLVAAGKQGLGQFASNFFNHLKKALINWLTGALSGAGIYIPQALSLIEFGKMALSVLGISWPQIRAKIVKVLPGGETTMKVLEAGFDVIVALVKGGPAAAWEVIKDKLAGLRDTILQGIISFVTESIVKAAIVKLVSLLVPGAGFIQAIVTIVQTIMVFVQKLKEIAAMVAAFIDSIAAIANGQIGAAAGRVEAAMASALNIVVAFLAKFVGLGKVTDKIVAVIKKLQAKVDAALDKAIAWIVDKAKAILAKLLGKKDEKDDPEKSAKVAKGLDQLNSLTTSALKDGMIARADAQKIAAQVKGSNPVFKSITVVQGEGTWDYDYVASPGKRQKGGKQEGKDLREIIQGASTGVPKGSLFRADDNYSGGDVGIPLDDTAAREEADIQDPATHVLKKRPGATSTLTSFSQRLGKIGVPRSGAAYFTDTGKVVKVAIAKLAELAASGKIRMYTPAEVKAQILQADLEERKARGLDGNSADATKKANSVFDAMTKNHEVLIEGQIPANILVKVDPDTIQ